MLFNRGYNMTPGMIFFLHFMGVFFWGGGKEAITNKTRRMHSSRMRTARLWPVSPGMHCWGVPGPGGMCLVPGKVYLVWGVYLVLGGVPGPRGVYLVSGRYIWCQGAPGPRGVGWVYLVRGGTCPGTPPRGQNHRRLWKYNLAPTSLRAVITYPCEGSCIH